MGSSPPALDEEALGAGLSRADRRAHGVYFTPAPLVEHLLSLCAPLVPAGVPVAVVDPACGAGAFLSAAARWFPEARLLGLELSPEFAHTCRQRVPRAEVLEGDGLRGGLEPLLARIPPGTFELWIGNPPYNGTSAVLRDPAAYARARRLMPDGVALPRGTSLRDDFAFFLLIAARRLATAPGMLAFVTSATLLDAYLYAPLRSALLDPGALGLALQHVHDLGAGVFARTQVRSCLTVWTRAARGAGEAEGTAPGEVHGQRAAEASEAQAPGALSRRTEVGSREAGGADEARGPSTPSRPGEVGSRGAGGADEAQGPGTLSRPSEVRYRARARGTGFAPEQLGPEQRFTPQAPDFLLRPQDLSAAALDRAWTEAGEPLTQLVPISFPGLKTRFDELLVDDDRERLATRVAALLADPPPETSESAWAEAFAAAHALPPRTLSKLIALRTEAARLDVRFDATCLRPYFRYAGARHRGGVPESARAWCYLDRRLIPRGDHRLRGGYDPHAGAVKLLFNVRELPLTAALLDVEGCVHDHRHTRFAPLWVPARLRDEGLGATRDGGDLGPPVPNLSARGLAWAERLGGPESAFRAIARFINSPDVQERWAPAYGATRELSVPLDGEAALGGDPPR